MKMFKAVNIFLGYYFALTRVIQPKIIYVVAYFRKDVLMLYGT